jgi:hypothetical protein
MIDPAIGTKPLTSHNRTPTATKTSVIFYLRFFASSNFTFSFVP